MTLKMEHSEYESSRRIIQSEIRSDLQQRDGGMRFPLETTIDQM